MNQKRCRQKQRWGWRTSAGKPIPPLVLFWKQTVLDAFSVAHLVSGYLTWNRTNKMFFLFLGRLQHLLDLIPSTRASRASLIIRNSGREKWRPSLKTHKSQQSFVTNQIFVQFNRVCYLWKHNFFSYCCLKQLVSFLNVTHKMVFSVFSGWDWGCISSSEHHWLILQPVSHWAGTLGGSFVNSILEGVSKMSPNIFYGFQCFAVS